MLIFNWEALQLKEFLIALSLANLCFYNIILAFFYKNQFYLKIIPGTNQFLALILSELLIAALFWLAWRLVKKINNRYLILFAKFILCLLVLIFIYDLARDFKSYFNIKLFRVFLLVSLIILLIRKKTAKVATSLLLLLAPFVGIVFFQAFQGIITDFTKEAPPEVKQQVKAGDNSPRVLWLIFDGMDYRLAFADRPEHLKMPEFDGLQQQSLTARNAHPPGIETITSMPALIDGRMISAAGIEGADKLKIRYADSNEDVYWGSQPNIFSRARDLKLNTAFVGEYLPYSRIIGKDLTFCDWFQYYPQYTHPGSVFVNMYQQIRMLLIGPARHYMQRKEAYLEVHRITKRLVADFDYNLIMIHNPIPHYPYFHQQPWWDYRSMEGYFNALKLVDQTLGEIRRIMEEQGTWDATNVIISADHGLYRWYDGKPETRVPFIVKLAGQKEPVKYEPAFNTVITQELVLAILKREVSTPGRLVDFLRRNGRMIEPEINRNQ